MKLSGWAIAGLVALGLIGTSIVSGVVNYVKFKKAEKIIDAHLVEYNEMIDKIGRDMEVRGIYNEIELARQVVAATKRFVKRYA